MALLPQKVFNKRCDWSAVSWFQIICFGEVYGNAPAQPKR